MNLETFFTTEDIKHIYELVTIYSIKKYQTLPQVWRSIFQQKYQTALSNLEKLNISVQELEKENIESIYSKLENYQILYNSLMEQNKNIIALYTSRIEAKILEVINQYPTELERISFLFQFITEYITYSEDYFNYCLQVPPIDGFIFDFKNNIPVDSGINGMLVIGQGLCDDISNLMMYLGKKLNLNIDKIFSKYKDNHHSLNIITLNDQRFLMDATRKIRKDKTIKECFLVSVTTLNKDESFTFNENIPKTSDYMKEIPSYQEEVSKLMKELRTLTPQIIDLNQTTNQSLKK